MLKKIWYIYIVECCDKTLYTGITTELERRLEEHNNSAQKGAYYTRIRRPVKLVYHETAATRAKAMEREAKIKKMARDSKIKLIAQCRGM
ncbi:MAG: GIY-YIG nuclease family protein [Spirochaetes bacterium]|nr:GIY-YIG nuclease family protein [Spirochaetota bacterium]